MIDNFIPCVGFSLRQEGGFSNVAGDPGGATDHGVTIATLSIFLERKATLQDVERVTDIQAEQIYKPRYWMVVNGDKLPLGIDLVTMDFGITAGPITAARVLQRVAGATVDGFIGQATIETLASRPVNEFISDLTVARENYYQTLAGFAQFGKGWLARSARCQTMALAMVQVG